MIHNVGEAKGLTASMIAEHLHKPKRIVEGRIRFLQRCEKDLDTGYPITPQLLRISLFAKKRFSARLWLRACSDPHHPNVSLSAFSYKVRKECRCIYYSGYKKDTKLFLRAWINHIKTRSDKNTRSLVQLEQELQNSSLPLDEFICKMCVFLLNSRIRDEAYIKKMYGDVHSRQRKGIRAYMVKKYMDEIDIVMRSDGGAADTRSNGDVANARRNVEEARDTKRVEHRQGDFRKSIRRFDGGGSR